MKLIYKGKFNGDPASLPCGEHQPNAVKFKEFDDPKALARGMNLLALLLTVGLFAVFCLRAGIRNFSMSGCLVAIALLFPHEIHFSRY